MAKVTVYPAHIADAVELEENLRAIDRIECEAHGPDVLDGIVDSIARSTHCWVARDGAEMLAVFGAAPLSLLGGVASPWLLGTPALDRRPKVLQRVTPVYMQKILDNYRYLVNWVHAENRTSVRWLRRLGFTVHPATPYGRAGQLFHKFEMHANV